MGQALQLAAPCRPARPRQMSPIRSNRLTFTFSANFARANSMGTGLRNIKWHSTLETEASPVKVATASRCSLIFRSEEHTSELQSLMRISYAVFCLKKKKPQNNE